MEKINERTPSAGDYSEAYYFDSEGNPTDDKDTASNVIIRLIDWIFDRVGLSKYFEYQNIA